MLTEEQLAVLRAAVDRIVPLDDFPGGWEAGVGDYLQRQFERDLAPFIESYRAGLAALDAEARESTGVGFADLEALWQDALLARVEAGKVATVWPVEPEPFFRKLVEHAMEGFYSDPGNGGNRDGIAWKMIGFEVNK